MAPREIAFDQALPHTRSGKVMRRLLKARELGLPEGDLSTVGDAAMSDRDDAMHDGPPCQELSPSRSGAARAR